ncbi:MAG: PEP-CTERM sorting domain-containing protein [Limisphaerales bacterium]
MNKRLAYFAATTTVLSLFSVCWADDIAQENVANFGMEGQLNDGIVNGDSACGPTSAYNSFVYLDNTWGITGLLQPTAAETINQLGSYMGYGDNTHAGTPAGGVTTAQFLSGKTQYIDAQSLNTTITVESETGAANINWEFIYGQLQQNQDVEILFDWNSPATGGHVVTVTGIDWNPATDTGTLSFIDPYNPLGDNSPALAITGNLGGSDGNGFTLSYFGGGAGNGASGEIDGVVAESPIPEPATVSLLALGALGLLRRRQGKV